MGLMMVDRPLPISVLIVALVGALAGGGLGAPPKDAEVIAAVDRFEKLRVELDLAPYSLEARVGAADDALAGLDLACAALEQLQRLFDCRALIYATGRPQAIDRLGTLASAPTLDGMSAAMLRVQSAGYAPDFDNPDQFDEQIRICRAALRHPALRDALDTGRADALPRAVSRSFVWTVCDAIRPDMLALEPILISGTVDLGDARTSVAADGSGRARRVGEPRAGGLPGRGHSKVARVRTTNLELFLFGKTNPVDHTRRERAASG